MITLVDIILVEGLLRIIEPNLGVVLAATLYSWLRVLEEKSDK
jgi:hypothetical protein